jgi:hypothetical protein
VKKILPPYRTDLTLRKETRDRNWSNAFLYDAAVVMRMAEQPLASPAAAEQQCP